MTDVRRRQELALIHVAKKDLALSDETYRAILARVCGVATAAALDQAGRDRLIGHFKSLGWTYKPKAPKRAGTRPLAQGEQARKIRALWLSLYHLGALQDPSESALAAFVKRQTRRDALQWLTPAEANGVIEALKAWCARNGFPEAIPEQVEQIDRWRREAGLPTGGVGFATKVNLMRAQWQRLIALGAMRAGAHAQLDRWIQHRYGAAAPWCLALEDADRAVEALGRWLRRAVSKAQPADASNAPGTEAHGTATG